MAACLNPRCDYQKARVTYSRTIRAEDGTKETWRIVQCAPSTSGGCGQRRKQTIRDEGETTASWIEPQERGQPSRVAT